MKHIVLTVIVSLLTITTGFTSAYADEASRGEGACCIGGECYQATVEECDEAGGSWSGGECDNCACSPCGTCCDGENCYEDVPEDDCAMFGDWYGSTPCSSIQCGPETGACCYEFECYDITEDQCYDLDDLYAVWLGYGTSCDTDECPPPAGACCNGLNCWSTLEDNCDGIWIGDGIDCYDGICDQMGACCIDSHCWNEYMWSDCEDEGGIFLGSGVECNPKSCILWGACCLNTGGCEMTMDESECIDYNGTYAGDGTSCNDEPPHCAEEVWGACCMGEDCVGLTDWECGNIGGSFHADVGCNEDPCAPATGACCIGDECIVSTEADCDGKYIGDGTDCSVNNCISDDGACCWNNGNNCIQLPNEIGEEQCWNLLSGTWMGAGTSCADVNCLAGACCYKEMNGNLNCVEGYTEEDCELGGGDYLGDLSTCEEEGAWCSTQIGACCFNDSECSDGITGTECAEWGGDFFGGGSTCADDGFYCQTGACCFNDSGYLYCWETSYNECDGNWYGYGTDCTDVTDCDSGSYGACCLWGECHEMYQSECSWAGGSWSGGDCESCSCTWPCGTCCFGDSCEEDVSSDECDWAGGTFLGDVPCTEELCAPPPPTGACCVDGQCTIETEEDCSGLYLGDDMPCDSNPCGNDGGDGPFIGIAYDVLGRNLVADDEETWTVDVYAVLAAGCRLDAVAGDVNQDKMVSTTGTFYQHPFGGATSQAINSVLFGAYPDLEYDSFMTIGLTDLSGNALSDIGIDWTDFEAGGAVNSTDGSWYVTPADAQGDSEWFQDQFCEDNNGVRIARLTVRGLDSIVFVEALFQGKDVDGDTWQDSDLMAIAYDDCDAPTSCIGDVNLDGMVDVLDLLLVISDWGSCNGSCPSDIDGNGAVDVLDLLKVIANWGPCPWEPCSDGWDCAIGGYLEDYACGDGGGTCIDAFPSDDTTLGGTGIGFWPDGIGPLWRDDQSLTETFACAELSINTLDLLIDIVNGMDDDGGTAMHTWNVRVNGTSVGQFSVITGQNEINESFSFLTIPAQAGGTYEIQLQATNQVYSGGGSYHMAYTGGPDHSVELGNTSSCYCFGLADGSHACVELFSESCSDYTDCDENGGCPEGFECVTTTCCGDPVCMPICE